ncbi:MAG: Nif3-like dinuclear metal center hexameric protein [Phycisphaerales bacterium]|nr:Nif3-like dinuclear metal center hexameric protein [Phycisphaerales bacterium]
MKVQDLVDVMDRIAPVRYAAEWDKVGLLTGARGRELRGPVVLTIDLTESVLEDAIARRAGAIIAYHPPIWDPLRRITTDTPRQRIVLGAVEAGMAIYSPHTALDAVPGGVADWLAEGLSGSPTPAKIQGDCRALTPMGDHKVTQEVKVVTFVPREKADAVRNALASAGAGLIGNYQLCSFAAPGQGTFLGGEGTCPSVGRAGEIEQVDELRLEMVCSRAALPLALETMRRFHPYEEPAIDVYPLEDQPQRNIGPGRRLVLDRPTTVGELAARLKSFVGAESVRMALVGDDTPVTHVGICPGSGASLAPIAGREACQVYVTGEMNHHDVLATLHAGMSVILGGHTNTERGFLPRLRGMIRQQLPALEVIVSGVDRDPLVTL